MPDQLLPARRLDPPNAPATRREPRGSRGGRREEDARPAAARGPRNVCAGASARVAALMQRSGDNPTDAPQRRGERMSAWHAVSSLITSSGSVLPAARRALPGARPPMPEQLMVGGTASVWREREQPTQRRGRLRWRRLMLGRTLQRGVWPATTVSQSARRKASPRQRAATRFRAPCQAFASQREQQRRCRWRRYQSAARARQSPALQAVRDADRWLSCSARAARASTHRRQGQRAQSGWARAAAAPADRDHPLRRQGLKYKYR